MISFALHVAAFLFLLFVDSLTALQRCIIAGVRWLFRLPFRKRNYHSLHTAPRAWRKL